MLPLFRPLIRPLAQQSLFSAKRFFSATRNPAFRMYNGYNNNYSTLKKALIYGGAFITATTIATPYLFQYTPLSYFKKHPQQLVYSLMAANIMVFGAWRLPQCYKVLSRHFLLNKNSLTSTFSLIGNAFSHQEFWHLAMNMLALYSFGTSLIQVIGASNFTTLYLNSAVVASIFSIIYPIVFRIPLIGPSLGASGALFGIFGTFASLFPTAKIMLFVFPVPGGAIAAFLGSVAWNIAGCVFRWGSFDYAAHLGGSLFGVLYGFYIHQVIKSQQERRRARYW